MLFGKKKIQNENDSSRKKNMCNSFWDGINLICLKEPRRGQKIVAGCSPKLTPKRDTRDILMALATAIRKEEDILEYLQSFLEHVGSEPILLENYD